MDLCILNNTYYMPMVKILYDFIFFITFSKLPLIIWYEFMTVVVDYDYSGTC